MKIIDLNRRYLAHRKHGHVKAVRWDSWFSETPISPSTFEYNCVEVLGHPQSLRWDDDARWCGYFGTASGLRRRPYYVTFKNPQDLLMVLLRMPQYENN